MVISEIPFWIDDVCRDGDAGGFFLLDLREEVDDFVSVCHAQLFVDVFIVDLQFLEVEECLTDGLAEQLQAIGLVGELAFVGFKDH